ncbi:MAG: glycosyltransferase involved in cell wall biosynthesis [Flavobacteriaceae bacterium]|jgi:glycosyltransferase involved in cell wall biosynthesis
MPEKPSITVLMPVYNCEDYVKEAVESIINQTYSNFEFLIIDDASNDNTVSIIKAIKDSRIVLFEKPKNTGYTESLNYGLSIAKGEFIARMDADDMSLPERLSKQLTYMESNPETIVCGSFYEIIGSGEIKKFPVLHEDLKINLLRNSCFAHPSVMIRKSVLDAHRIQYDSAKEPAEDYALWVALLPFGKFHNLEDVLLKYRIHEHQVSKKRRKVQLDSKLSTRVKVLEYLDVKLDIASIDVLKKIVLFDRLELDEVLSFFVLKDKFIKENNRLHVFSEIQFKAYMDELEEKNLKLYFFENPHFTYTIYKQYLKFKKSRNFELTLYEAFIIFMKCVFRSKTVMH